MFNREGRTPTHGYAPTREAAMAAFAKSWRRESRHVSFQGYSKKWTNLFAGPSVANETLT
jgi:hypothetical protein